MTKINLPQIVTVDVSETVVKSATALDVGDVFKRLSQNKVRLTLNIDQYHNLVEHATRCLDIDSADARHNRNMKQAGEAVLRALAKPENKPASPKPAKSTAKPKKVKPAPIAPEDRPDPVATVDPTKVTYDTLTKAFAEFNIALFHGKLPPVMLVIHRKRNAAGYFWNGVWANGEDKDAKLSEIALNPELMGRNAKEVLSTLVHEMVHHEQQVFGKPSKSGHNVEWCAWMERVGLTPRGVGNCKGKKSGRNFTHDIVEGGAFDNAATVFLARDDIDMSWFSPRAGGAAKKQDYSKVKHTCACGCNIWGKYNPDAEDDSNLDVFCGKCEEPFEPVLYV